MDRNGQFSSIDFSLQEQSMVSVSTDKVYNALISPPGRENLSEAGDQDWT
jgi:hypothetical protein